MISGLDITVARGDTTTLVFTLTRLDEDSVLQPYPIAPETHDAWLTVKRSPIDADEDAAIQHVLSDGQMVVDENVVTVVLSADEMSALDPATYFYDLQVRVTLGGEVATVALGRLVVYADMTRA